MYSSNTYSSNVNPTYTSYSYTNQSQSQPLQSKTISLEATPEMASLKYGGLTDITGAKSVAKRLLEMYDRDRDGQLSNTEIVPMMTDAYQSMNRRFNPSKQDIDAFFRVVDRNKDGRINYEDIENMCIKYLTTGYLKEGMGFK